MQRSTIVTLVGAFTLLVVFYSWARLKSEFGPKVLLPIPSPALNSPDLHTATQKMLETTKQMMTREAPSFEAQATDGKTYALKDIVLEGPMVLVFIKDGCPCSQSAQLFYNRLHALYRGQVSFFGIINKDVELGIEWARKNRAAFPILSDPDMKIVHEYKAENSAYLAIISKGGTLDKYWPGYSSQMLKEANERLAELCAVEEKIIDLTDAPESLYTGCPY